MTAYNETAKKWPMSTGVVTTVIKTSGADMFAQKVVEGRDEIDWKRNGLFTFFGFAYLGCFQYWLYNDLFVRICKPITAVVGHLGSAPVKVFIDQCIHHPLFYFPCFYALKGTVEGRPLASSFTKYQEDMWENCKALWAVWVPAQLVNFGVVPLHLRIPYVAGVSFAWTVIISVMRGSLDKVEDPAEVPYTQQYSHSDADSGSNNAVAAAATAAAVATAAATASAAPAAGAAAARSIAAAGAAPTRASLASASAKTAPA